MKDCLPVNLLSWVGMKSLRCSLLLFIGCIFIFPAYAERSRDPLPAELSKKITGVVKDETGDPLAGVSIVVKGSAVSTLSDQEGHYQLEVPDEAQILVFSFVGKVTQEVKLGAATVYNVVLPARNIELDSVIVVSTGYMTQKKADLTGAVSVVTRNDFAKNPGANVLRSLQGKIPGVFITTDGNPAEWANVTMRGITSINSSPPLIVLDGQPVNINFRDINPNDIETIQVLKDAASASIYGSRAAGGVLLITTRKGKQGETRVTYEGFVGVSKIGGVPDMLDAEGYGRGLWQATVNDGDDPASIRIYNYDWKIEDGLPGLLAVKPVEWLNNEKTMPSSNTNWFDAGTRTALQQNHQLTISGGTNRLSSLFSLNYYENQGTQITSFFRRYAARFNNEYELIKGRLTVGENLTLTHLKFRDVNSTYSFLVMPPNIPVYDNNGGWGGVAMGLGMDDFNNPVRDLEINKDNAGNFLKILGTAYASLKILDNLTLRTQFGLDYSMWYDRNIQHKWKEAGGKSNDINGVTQNNWHNIGRTWTNTLIYNLKIHNHQIDILGGIEAYQFVAESFKGYRTELELETQDYAYLTAATGDTKLLEGGGDERAMLSYFGKINYAFNSRYLLSLTFRRDGSSAFGANNRFSNFPAVSAGWRLSEESFLKKINFIDDLKLRASWGQNGNSAPLSAGKLVNMYLADFNGTSYPIAGNNISNGIPSGYRRASLGNPDLKWETTTQTNIGLDFSVLRNRLSGSIDWFNKKTNDMLFEPPYIGSLGEGGFRWINAADMTNQGFEVLVSWGEQHRNYTYRITTNFSAYKNKINSLPENVKYTYGGNGLLDNVIGRPLHSFYGLVADGLFKTQEEVDNSADQPGKGLGRIRYKDLDGDGVINEAFDRTWIGVSDPKLIAGLNLEASYKNFDITVFFQGVFGNDVYNSWKELSDFWNIGVHNDRNHPSRILDAWTPKNPGSNIPALSRRDANGEKRMSTYFIEDGSYIKLRTVDIGYTFPLKMISRMKMNRLRVYVSGQNLMQLKKTWGNNRFTGGDPENPGTGYPRPSTYFVGVNVTF